MDLIDKLKKELQLPLPGIESHKAFYPMRGEIPNDHENYRKSAVGLHLFYLENVLKLLLIKRSSFKGPHSGQMAFPGGKFELKDETLEYTARRESFEEVGISVGSGLLLGQLTEVNIPVSRFKVHPFIFYHEVAPPLIMNEEVEKIELISLNDLLNQANVGETNIELGDKRYLKKIPCFLLNQQEVWGATSIILNELKQIMLRKIIYSG